MENLTPEATVKDPFKTGRELGRLETLEAVLKLTAAYRHVLPEQFLDGMIKIADSLRGETS